MTTFPTLRHLRAFLLVASGMSAHAAARSMHVSQPALTQAIAGLERRYGAPLFERRPMSLNRTEAGAALARRVSHCFAFLQHAAARALCLEAEDPAVERAVQRLTIPHLKALTALAEVGGFTGAAEHLGLRPPTIHRAVGELEEILGTRLVRRSSLGAEIMVAGQEVARLFGLALVELYAAADDIEELRGIVEGRLSIGTMHVSASGVVPAAMIRLASRFPRATLVAKEDYYEPMLDGLRAGRLDFVCSTVRAPPPVDVAGQILFDSDLCIICRHGHPVLRHGARPPLEELARYPWAGSSPRTDATMRFVAMYERAGIEPPRIVVETLVFEIKRALVLGSDFLAIATRAELISHHGFHMMEIIKGMIPGATRPVWLLWRRDWRPTRLQRSFAETLIEILREANPAAPAFWEGPG